MIPFNQPIKNETIFRYIKSGFGEKLLRGEGTYCNRCSLWMEERFHAKKVLLTSSCSHSLEMAALLLDVKPGDEIIMPSFTFCSTANAFVLRGGIAVFVDVRPDTMNIDETLIEEAITEKTRGIAVVHYGGVACEMDKIIDIARRHNLFVVEDAAQGVMSTYKGKALGTIGDIGCYSFHETKNYSMGEGGATLVNRSELVERAEIIREKGTNRSQFLRGQVDKYSWVDIGSSYLPSDLAAAYLYAQLEMADEINEDRLRSWNLYYALLQPLAEEGIIDIPVVPEGCRHNAHLFFIKAKDIEERTALIAYLKEHGIVALFHYVPLHSSVAGRKYGRFHGEDRFTTQESERLVRLPMFCGLTEAQVRFIAKRIWAFYHSKG